MTNIIFVIHNNDMPFFDRIDEQARLRKALASKHSKMIVLYGRRRCGKSTLLRHLLEKKDVYFMARQLDPALQRQALIRTLAEQLPIFRGVQFSDWPTLFEFIQSALKANPTPITICIDELPYLVKTSPEIPSILQHLVDNKERNFHLVLCGSSQQMMHGLVLDSAAPLYGRADEILKILPIKPGWLMDALELNPVQCVEEHAIWGGVPRYWEIRKEAPNMEAAIKQHLLDRLGVLHEEPPRLFYDDMRESTQAYSILSIVGNGVHRLSEIAGRLNKPATQLSRPLAQLIDLGYLHREIPYGASPKSNKKSLYKIADPLMNFYFTYVTPNLSRLQLDMVNDVYAQIRPSFVHFFAAEWESLCRKAISYLEIDGHRFDIAKRWWGTNLEKNKMEIDIVAESIDGQSILYGECKWGQPKDIEAQLSKLAQKTAICPVTKGKKVITRLFLKEHPDPHDAIILPASILGVLK